MSSRHLLPALLLALAGAAAAQSAPSPHTAAQVHDGPASDRTGAGHNPTDVDTLLVVWWSEAGPSSTRSHAAIGHVLQRWASRHGASLEDAADALVWPYSHALRDRPWLRALTPACERPDGYRWRWDRDLCLEVVARASAFLRGELQDPCRGRATGWRTANSRALKLALRRGFVRVRCVGGTSLSFVQESA